MDLIWAVEAPMIDKARLRLFRQVADRVGDAGGE
jgi:hypothetical protein